MQPSEAYRVKLTPEQFRQIFEQRRQRDIAAPAHAEPDTGKAQTDPPPLVADPQLDKAVEYIQQQIARGTA